MFITCLSLYDSSCLECPFCSTLDIQILRILQGAAGFTEKMTLELDVMICTGAYQKEKDGVEGKVEVEWYML